MGRALGIFAALYVFVGVVLGGILYRAIPAVNVAGWAYYAAIWPGFISAGTFHTPTPPIPAWAFTFRNRQRAGGDGG